MLILQSVENLRYWLILQPSNLSKVAQTKNKFSKSIFIQNFKSFSKF